MLLGISLKRAGDAAAVPDFYLSEEFQSGVVYGKRSGRYDGYLDGSNGRTKVSYDDTVESADFRYRLGYKNGYKIAYDRAYRRGVEDYKNSFSQRRNN